MAIRVLIVDDSPTMRALLRLMLERESDLEIVGAAANAVEARGMIRELNPDVVTLDIEMPGMNGLEFLEKIMRLRPMPVIIVSSLTREGTSTTVRALELGAINCYAKPTGVATDLVTADGGRLANLIREAAQVKVSGHASVATAAAPAKSQTAHVQASMVLTSARSSGGDAIIAIGASTGGVEALSNLLRRFPEDCPPTVIVQHINGQFAPAMAARLDSLCAPKVVLADSDIAIKRGHIYIAPGNDRHFTVRGAPGRLYCKMRPGDLVSGHRPSIDAMFLSAAEAMQGQAVGILLTGMGQDGAKGLLAMRNSGCRTIAQDQASCVVYGMPRAAVELGAADYVVNLSKIADKALELVAA
ncbi:protein-glutamate methylesterase/protein-glutamine glutaminase [Sphingobium sufflavum]|uniref:protein-glutamate methylesterase/protein-glutamine glutaminase n=1 Tax=Sphingobium sufflavum TaxID=1129547 RepID=UPI0022795DAB|nr:chemotaxis response regulator protein-glutamate methylesterase [Sphingobium sufflavum]